VSRTVLYKWIKLKKTKGSLQDAPPTRGWKKIDPEVLLNLVSAHPDWILSQYADHLGASVNAVWKALKRLKITRKKRPYAIKNVTSSRDQYFWSKSKT
jgi:putative transposase